MWMSKLVLNLSSARARMDLASPYEMHRTLSRAVAHSLSAGRERLLWRQEPARRHDCPVVVVQTLTEPDWSVLERGYADIFPPKPFHPRLTEGQTLRFRIRANPSKRVKETGKRVALKTQAEKLAWLAHRLEAGGFELPGEEGHRAAHILEDVFLEVRRAGCVVQVQAVLFEGVLRVRDPQAALVTLERGIGPGKALGLGLLSICP